MLIDTRNQSQVRKPPTRHQHLKQDNIDQAEDISEPQRHDEEEIDKSLTQFTSKLRRTTNGSNQKKGNVQTVEWTEELEKLRQEKQAADAMRDLKTRLQGSSALRTDPRASNRTKRAKSPVADRRGENAPNVSTQDEMEAFLDDLI
ncbi:uncharacterized protein EI90DRAFT_3071777, partial [Cantharellus anzutake]|uniref:uncharacterized protein n=1 Tax=Cantharellus anzutake TaxID=1750568 RepID=UPI001906AAEB